MIKSNRNIISTIAILFGMAIVVSCENDSDQIDKMSANTILPILEIWEFERVHTKNGKEMVRITAPYMQSFENDSTVYLLTKGFHMETYSYEGGVKFIKSEIDADSARYVVTKRLDAFKNVVVKDIKGDKLQTNFLSWDEKNKRISTSHPFRITGPTQNIEGIGLEAKQDLSDYTYHKITGTIKPNVK